MHYSHSNQNLADNKSRKIGCEQKFSSRTFSIGYHNNTEHILCTEDPEASHAKPPTNPLPEPSRFRKNKEIAKVATKGKQTSHIGGENGLEERKSALAYMHPEKRKKSHAFRLECVQLARLVGRE